MELYRLWKLFVYKYIFITYYLAVFKWGRAWIMVCFMSVGTFVTMVDFGFSPQIARFVTYAYAGADSLKKSGIVSAVHTEMNAELLLKLLIASRRLYLFLSLFVFILLITVGSYYVTVISKTLPYRQVLCSWIIFL